ncbi:hypothetical protein [Tepidibacter hydrothermalis]|uniref:Lipoprotein n=1 Tax=Tepidibacter hydrothermalis TaxID=3036126 RepID=A0ABY8EHM5_9FIRM|nr:hypothetical protein [Tepidibacter hydrothermalis]WFD11264.1 hypothetical protein P4S50_04080 [Tepidibacter hydrothermalis]
MKKKKTILILVIFVFLGVLTACNNNDAVMSHNSNDVKASKNNKSNVQITSVGNSDEKISSNNTQTIIDIENWNHSIKKFFYKGELLKIELTKQKTYPIFYVNHATVSKDKVINYYLDGTYLSMLKDNGFWNFEIRGIDQKSIRIIGDKEGKCISKIFLDDEQIDIQKYGDEAKLVLNALKARLIKKDNSSDYYYFRSPYNQNKHPKYDEDFYCLNPITYDDKSKAYLILLSRKTDTVATYYHAVLNKNNVYFYYDTQSYDYNEAEEVNHDFIEVENLFIDRFFIHNKNKDDNNLALKDAPNKFLYQVHVWEFDYSNNKYCITLSRSSDTAQNFFLYDADLDKFYRDGSPPEEIKCQNDVYIYIPFYMDDIEE